MDPLSLAILGGSLISGVGSIFGMSQQAKQQQAAIQAQQQMFQKAYAANQPFIQAGQSAIPTLQGLLGLGGQGGAGMTDVLKNVPGFQFISSLAQQGVTNQGTATGLGGNTLLAGAQAGTNVALGSAWQPIVSSLQNLLQTGAGSAQALGGQAIQAGQGIGSSMSGLGSIYAGGITGAGNAASSGITGAAFAPYLANLLNTKAGGTNAPLSMFGASATPGTLWYNQNPT